MNNDSNYSQLSFISAALSHNRTAIAESSTAPIALNPLLIVAAQRLQDLRDREILRIPENPNLDNFAISSDNSTQDIESKQASFTATLISKHESIQR